MKKIKILVVEDEVIVAKDIQKTLIKLGYDVPATAATATQAFDRFKEVKPDLVFCDIRLKGDVDGIEVAERLNDQYEVPVIFLTSYVDKATLDRAKLTQPYGYIVKPFNEGDLQSSIEMALYKHGKDVELRENERRIANALQNVKEGILITDASHKITFLNGKAEELLHLKIQNDLNLQINDVLTIDESNFSISPRDIKEPLNFRKVNVTNVKSQEQNIYNLTVSPIYDEHNMLIGRAYMFLPEESASFGSHSKNILDNTSLYDAFFVKKGTQLVKVPMDNIYWVQAMDNYVVIQTTTDQFIIHSTMKEIEMKLPPEVFVRVHRSYIVKLSKIQMLDENDIIINDKSIPIGKSYKESFRQRLNLL